MNAVQVVRRSLLALQVCVPKDLGNAEIEDQTNSIEPTGIRSGWTIVDDGNDCLAGDPSRVQCHDDPNRVHLVLTC